MPIPHQTTPPESLAANIPSAAAAHTLTDYLAAVAAGTPTPGGGSVVALAAALAAADETAYGRYATAAALPKTTDAEKATRRAAMQEALVAATDVPLAVAEACLALTNALDPITRLGNKFLLSDAAIAAHLARAALHGALLNLRANARLMTDHAQSVAYLRRADDAEQQGELALGHLSVALSARGV